MKDVLETFYVSKKIIMAEEEKLDAEYRPIEEDIRQVKKWVNR